MFLSLFQSIFQLIQKRQRFWGSPFYGMASQKITKDMIWMLTFFFFFCSLLFFQYIIVQTEAYKVDIFTIIESSKHSLTCAVMILTKYVLQSIKNNTSVTIIQLGKQKHLINFNCKKDLGIFK